MSNSKYFQLLKSKKLHLPQQFDARLQWPLCWSVHQVANQGGCGSCWVNLLSSCRIDLKGEILEIANLKNQKSNPS